MLAKAKTVARGPSTGISLYTLLAAVVVLGVLGSVIVTQFDGKNARATAALTLLESVGQASERFHLDTGCYPTNIPALQRLPTKNSETTCERPVGNKQWHGPYTKVFGTTTRRLELSQRCGQYIADFGTSAAICLNAQGEPYLSNLKNRLSDLVMQACGSQRCQQHGRGSGVQADVVLRTRPDKPFVFP